MGLAVRVIWLVTLVLIGLMVWASLASAMEAGKISLGFFRAQSPDAQKGLVAGAMAVTGVMGVVCERPGTVAEYVAGLNHRALDVAKPWVEHLLTFMDERACAVPEHPIDPKEGA